MNILLALLLTAGAPAGAKIVSHEQRLDLIRRAQVRRPVDPAAMDLLNGPQGDGSYTLGEAVPCRYEEKDPVHPLGGHSPKFPCHDKSDVRLKVKYDPEKNREVYGEVLGTRFLWALGFYADRMWSVKVQCENCPADPWTSTKDSPRALRTFEPATIQKRLKGTEVSEVEDEGWSFSELDVVNPAKGGASRADTDALKLAAAFMNHVDDTPNQQRLLCLDADPDCKAPVMYVTDVGGVFGGKNGTTSLRHWAAVKDLWKDKAQCVLALKGTDPDYKEPRISEAGRKLFSDLVGRLSEKQVRDLFLGARVDDLAKREPPVVGADGKPRPATVDDWVALFNEKRRQVESARCPE